MCAVLLMRVALYTLSIGDNCCRNLVVHACVMLYTLSTGKTCVVQDLCCAKKATFYARV